MNTELPILRFKGSRSYLHGTDILNATVATLQEIHGFISDIDLSFHKLCSRQLALQFNQDTDPDRVVAICRYKAEGQRSLVHLVDAGAPVIHRFPYDEKQVVRGMNYDLHHKSAVLQILTPYSRIEIWIAMVKALHLALYQEHRGQWLFVRARLTRYQKVVDSGPYSVRLVNSLGTKLTRTDIYEGMEKTGEIFFSLTPQSC
jgi:hypothetical protein